MTRWLCSTFLILLTATTTCVNATAESAQKTTDTESTSGTQTWPKDASIQPLAIKGTPNVSAYGKIVLFAGQPNVDSFADFAKLGVKRVLNIRSEKEIAQLGFNEKKVTMDAGLAYIQINVLKKDGGEATINAILDEIDKAPGEKTLVHCASSNRVGYVWSIYRALRHNLPVEEAITEGHKAGMKSPALEKRAREYIAAHKTKPTR